MIFKNFLTTTFAGPSTCPGDERSSALHSDCTQSLFCSYSRTSRNAYFKWSTDEQSSFSQQSIEQAISHSRRKRLHSTSRSEAPLILWDQAVLSCNGISYPFEHLKLQWLTGSQSQTPTKFELDLVSLNEVSSRKSRKLLNTEKLIFTTPEDSDLFCRVTILRINAIPEALRWDMSQPIERVLFNVAIGPTILGAPVECVPHILWVGLLLVFAPFVTRYIHREITLYDEICKHKR